MTQPLWSMNATIKSFGLCFFFFSLPSVNEIQGLDCQIYEVIACNERALDPIQMIHFI